MWELLFGLGGLGYLAYKKISDDAAKEVAATKINNKYKICEEFYSQFVDEDLESTILSSCKNAENIEKFKAVCKDIGVSSEHDGITNFHRMVILLACENKLPKEWFSNHVTTPELWHCFNKGFDFDWGDPLDNSATTKVLKWINKMVKDNGFNETLLRFSHYETGLTNIYQPISICLTDARPKPGRLNKTYKWKCSCEYDDKIQYYNK